MTDPETSQNVETESHSERPSDPSAGEAGGGRTGSDVGGPAQTTESASEDAVVGGTSGTAGQDDENDNQGMNPL